MAHVVHDFPGNHIIQQLVQRACGQFIYAATILKYVGDYHALPTEQLEIILNVNVPENFDSPYPDLDMLYMLILYSGIDEQDYKVTMSILSHIIFHKTAPAAATSALADPAAASTAGSNIITRLTPASTTALSSISRTTTFLIKPTSPMVSHFL
ncbi:hypothetical protein BDP27DRAFT_1418274 [Rhodocollybia butyracea]|uniref:Uncharacterized protein n=1 Tax=Rhodocollybia butyracea TaxID=206335 RepID=A0A9P5PZP6_9AGAR|nr:hypothetical protein BDP27DRAFT_1418274 [Rhodocollybia butyracea]